MASMTVPNLDKQRAIHDRAINFHPPAALIGMILTERPGTPNDQYVSYWFGAAPELAEFVMELFAYHYCDCDEDVAEEIPELAEIAERISRSAIGPSTAEELLKLGEFVSSHVRLCWVGNFADLCAAGGETEKFLAQWFRGNEDNSPIKYEEKADFIDFIIGEMRVL